MSPHLSRPSWRDRLSAATAARVRTRGTRSLGWRLLAPTVFVLAGLLFMTSMVSSQGTDLRAGRYDDLDGLATAEARQLEGLRTRTAALNAEVERLTKDLGSSAPGAEQQRVNALKGPAGLTPVHGPGLTITLDDAPDDALEAAGSNVSELIVHQQDIQAVVNALWAGGAEAMTLQGQRVVATTGIKCVGNTVVLHGVPYSPPYRISAIGPVGQMLAAVNQSPYIALYLDLVEKGLGWKVRVNPELDMKGYDGSTDLDYARPATQKSDSGARS
jgi:uncharacterized protein YlxW (UPF0749 family)